MQARLKMKVFAFIISEATQATNTANLPAFCGEGKHFPQFSCKCCENGQFSRTMLPPRFEFPPEADSFLPPQTAEEYRQFIEQQQPQIDVVAKMFDELKERTGQTEDGMVLMEALAMLDWATQEAGRGRLIISVQPDGSNPLQLNTPSLAHCRQS